MPLVKQTFLKPGRYRVGYDADGSPILRDVTATDLKRYADNTNAALKAGVHSPLYDQHAPVGKTPIEFGKASKPKSALAVRGWLKKVEQAEDGSLDNVIDVTDPDARKGIKEGSVKFTSPSIEPLIDGKGRDFGMVFRHFALSPTPRNPDQTPLEEVLGEPAMQFSLDDLEPFQMADDDDKTTSADESEKNELPGQDQPTDNPDSDVGGNTDQGKKEEAIVALFKEIGIELPSDFSFGSDSGVDSLLAALKTKVAAEKKAEQEETKDENDDAPEATVAEPQGGMQFDENDPTVGPLVKKLRATQAKLNAQNRNELAARVDKVRIPFVREKLKAKLETVQFNDDGDAGASMTIAEVASLFDGLPEGLQFDEVAEVEPPEGSVATVDIANESDEKADEFADSLLEQHGWTKPKPWEFESDERFRGPGDKPAEAVARKGKQPVSAK